MSSQIIIIYHSFSVASLKQEPSSLPDIHFESRSKKRSKYSEMQNIFQKMKKPYPILPEERTVRDCWEVVLTARCKSCLMRMLQNCFQRRAALLGQVVSTNTVSTNTVVEHFFFPAIWHKMKNQNCETRTHQGCISWCLVCWHGRMGESILQAAFSYTFRLLS